MLWTLLLEALQYMELMHVFSNVSTRPLLFIPELQTLYSQILYLHMVVCFVLFCKFPVLSPLPALSVVVLCMIGLSAIPLLG